MENKASFRIKIIDFIEIIKKYLAKIKNIHSLFRGTSIK